jgi:capsular polysaccharide biosynthesis protein
MKYENISIVHLENGIDIDYNNTESNKEVIFSFDVEKNFIQKFTYTVDIHSDQIKNILSGVDRTIYIDTNCFLYYAFQYQESFAHYLTQCLPKIKYFLENSDKILVVPKSTYNNLCKDLFNVIGIDLNRVLVLENNIEYVFKTITTVEHIGPQWCGTGGEINFDAIEIYKKIRNNLELIPNKNPHRKIYLKRDGNSNSLYGNGEIGIFRKIDNENELIKFLSDSGFEIIELGSKTIKEKSKQLQDAHTVITQIGSNCMNLIFSNSIKNILLLSNDFPLGKDYYFQLIDILNPILSTKEIFQYSSSVYGADIKNPTNNPFSVDINTIKNYIDNLI